MKKRFLCLILAIVMIVPFVLASCGESESDKMKEIILGGENAEIDRALTLSVWLPTDAITIKGQTADLSQMSQQSKLELQKNYPDVYDFLKRVDAVEDAINKVLISRNYYTNIDIVPVNSEFYEETLAERFAKMDEKTDPFDMNARGDSSEYSNEVVEETVGNKKLYNLLYRPVDENQLDIFLIRDYGEYSGYDQYISYIEKDYLLPLNKITDGDGIFPKTNYLTASGAYTSINKLIREEILSNMKVNDYIYALPNNHLYSSQEYFAVNKAVFNKLANEFRAKDLTDLESIVAYMNAVQALGDSTIVPMVNSGSMPAFGLADFDNLTYCDSSLNEIFFNEEFVNFVRIYKQAQADGLISTSLDAGQTAAVELFLGESVEEINAKAEDYYLIPVGSHKVDSSELYSSMFAISTFTLDYDRAMKILNLLVSDSEIITLLQYGIENEDYSVSVEKINGKEVETLNLNKDTSYLMNNLYTGSSYYTYPHNGAEIDEWDDVKNANLNVDVSKYVNVEYYINNASLTSEQKELLAKRASLANLAKATFAELDAMSLESFENVVELVNNSGDLSDYTLINKFANETSYHKLISLYNNALDTGYCYTVINGIKYAIKDNIATVVSISADIEEVIIPKNITYGDSEYSVTSIKDYAFYDCDSITSITLGESITSIGDYAFGDCDSLTGVTLSNELTSIGRFAFNKCFGLTAIVIPDKVKSIGDYAFYGCSSLTINCKAKNQPNDWNAKWNYTNCPVVWAFEEN